MDKTTTRLCKEGTGNFGYARVLVEISAEKELKEKIEICYESKNMLNTGSKFMKVKYSWKPRKCSLCKVFGHSDSMCGVKLGNDRVKTIDFGQNGLNQGNNEKNNDGFKRMWNGSKNSNRNADKVGNGGGQKVTQGSKVLKTRMEFKPINRKANDRDLKLESPQKGKCNNQNMESNNEKSLQNASPKSPQRVNKELMEDIRRSTNKFAIFEEITNSEILEIQLQNEKDIVNKFVKNHRQPTLEDSKN
ncbi:ATPase, F1/V1/A1 complex, alpha/beta subunit [Tanacetum coccineum]